MICCAISIYHLYVSSTCFFLFLFKTILEVLAIGSSSVQSPSVYHLTSVIHHTGDSLNKGHYFSTLTNAKTKKMWRAYSRSAPDCMLWSEMTKALYPAGFALSHFDSYHFPLSLYPVIPCYIIFHII